MKRVKGLLKDFSEKSVDVAGYRDNVAMKGVPAKKCSPNKELPDARAESAANGLRDIVAWAAGHGGSDPDASSNTAPGRAKNRRVEVIVK